MSGLARGAYDIALKVLETNADFALLERWLQRPHVSRFWGPPELHQTLLAQRSRDTHALITADGKAVGYLCWQTLTPSELEDAGLVDLPDSLVDIDILIGETEFLGRGIGPRALGLLLAKLRGKGVAYAGLGTSTSNHAAIRAFEKSGFRPFRDFEDPEYGRCRYLVTQLFDAVEEPVATDGAANP